MTKLPETTATTISIESGKVRDLVICFFSVEAWKFFVSSARYFLQQYPEVTSKKPSDAWPESRAL